VQCKFSGVHCKSIGVRSLVQVVTNIKMNRFGFEAHASIHIDYNPDKFNENSNNIKTPDYWAIVSISSSYDGQAK